jgi:hypothetical protein
MWLTASWFVGELLGFGTKAQWEVDSYGFCEEFSKGKGKTSARF